MSEKKRNSLAVPADTQPLVSDNSSGSDSDLETDHHQSGFYLTVVLFFIFLLIVPFGLIHFETSAKWQKDITLAILSQIYPLSGARQIDLSTQSKVINQVVLIPDMPEFERGLYVPPLNVYLPDALAARIVEQEMEDDLPGMDGERERDWQTMTTYFNGFATRADTGAIYMGPFRLSSKLLSQYLAVKRYKVVPFTEEMLKNSSEILKSEGFEYEPMHGARGFFYLRGSQLEYRMALFAIRMKRMITIVATVGPDGYLYPATLLGHNLDPFYKGVLTPEDVAHHFTSKHASQIYLVIVFRVLMFFWCLSLLLLGGEFRIAPRFFPVSTKKVRLHHHAPYYILLAGGCVGVLINLLWWWIGSECEYYSLIGCVTLLVVGPGLFRR